MGSTPSSITFSPVTVKNNARKNITPVIHREKRDRKPRNIKRFSPTAMSSGDASGSGAVSGFNRVTTTM